MRLRELLGYGEDRPLNEHEAVLTADVEFFLHEAERTKVRYGHAFRLAHVTVNIRGYFVPYLNDIFMFFLINLNKL